MKREGLLKSALVAFLLFGILSPVAHADRDLDRGRGHDDRGSERGRGYDDRGRDRGRGGDDRRAHPERYRLDQRYRHDHYYPRRGYRVDRLPPRNRHFRYHDRDYYFYGGIWYRPEGVRFVVVAPPIGIVVPILPPFYTTIWIGGVPYYYANDAYYVWRPDLEGYMVTAPPAGADEQSLTVVPDELFIYPKQGQSEQQQADDRFACHRWSVGQTKYDPTAPPENITPKELSEKREAYQRAMRACLEGRGYSVR